MATEDRHMNFQRGDTQERPGMSLDKLEQNYELALLDWERFATMEKEAVWPIKRSKHLPKRLPKLGIVSDSSDNELPEQAIREQLVQVLGKCRTEEVMVRALERTLESQTKKLESERNQQHQLQQELQTILHEKEELRKLMHKEKIHFQRVASVIEMAERRLADNAEKMKKIDEDIMKIRRDAMELLQMYLVRNEVEGQVEALSSSITALQEQKAAALERMRASQEEEVKFYHSMKAAIRKVCDQHSESILKLDGKYEVLWPNVDHLLDWCNKLLQLTRPEVEALKVRAHHQTVKSSGTQLNDVLSQADTKGNNLKVTSRGAQPDVQVTDSQTAVHIMVQNEGFSSESQYSGTHGEAQLVCVNTGVGNAGRVLCGSTTAEGSAGGSPTADEQISEPADAQPNLSLRDQTASEPSKHSVQEVFVVKPSVVLTHAETTKALGNSSSALNEKYYHTNIVHHNDQTITGKFPVSQGCNTTTISTSSMNISMPSKNLISPLSPVHTLSACHIESVTVNEPTFDLLQKEINGDRDTVLVIEVVNDKEINVFANQTEYLPLVATELKSNIITAVGSPVVGHLPNNTVIVVTEGKASPASSSVPDSMN